MNASGIFFFVVGPSGAGKDSLIEGLRRDDRHGLGTFTFARRVITRPAGSAGEDHEAMDEAGFAALESRDGFLITWGAHGLRYGLRRELLNTLAAGGHVVANGSRAMIGELAGRVPRFVVIDVTAPPEVLFARIMSRGRETEAQVRERVARKVDAAPADVVSFTVCNDATVDEGIARFIGAFRSAIRMPQSALAMQRKLRGEPLDEQAWREVLDDIVAGRYEHDQVDDFLIKASGSLTDEETVTVARVRASHAPRIEWNDTIVVDKHSMGGVPGSRITLIVVPIVAAFGMVMPKTSSRAITSAAGTADAMETVARVDLDAADVRRCVSQAHGCIAWNGGLNHSIIDDRINALTRPLGLATNRWSVASILSKKHSAGATHVVIDIPWGARTKLGTEAEARALADLFDFVGQGLGLHVKALVTGGSAPVGRGIGPALEVRDVGLILDNDASGPSDLREKALSFAATILAWSPDMADVAMARSTAEQILASGRARAAFDRIVDAQGRREPPVLPSSRKQYVRSPRAGVVTAIDGWHVAGIARSAGAPLDLGAGVDLKVVIGQAVGLGDALYIIHGDDEVALDEAAARAETSSGVTVESAGDSRSC